MNRWGVLNEDLFGIMIPLVAIIGWVAYAIVSAVTRGRVRELEVRERIVMIEKGLVPPPEVDPRGFERQMSRMDDPARGYYRYRGYRRRRSGFMLIAVGLGLLVMLYPNFRVGGFLLVMGLVFTLFGVLDRPPEPPYPNLGPPPEPPRRPNP
jgi:hypothetical protein